MQKQPLVKNIGYVLIAVENLLKAEKKPFDEFLKSYKELKQAYKVTTSKPKG